MGNAVVKVNGHAYENEGAVADGGFATVYRVRRGHEVFALKWTRGVSEREQLQRVLQEIQVHRQLQHPNAMRLVEAEVRVQQSPGSKNGEDKVAVQGLVPTYDGDKSNSTFTQTKEVLLVFPLYPRGTLQHHLELAHQQKQAAFSETECLRMFVLIVEAVLELQARGFAHRDIKPHNVLLTSSDPVEPILTDFGSVAPVTMTCHTSHEAMELFEQAAQFSSAAYRSPELWEAYGNGLGTTGTSTSSGRRLELDGRADVWALGCLLYAMAFGPYSPFDDPKQGVLQLAIFSGSVRFPANNSRFEESFSVRFVALIKWMLTVDMQDRPSIYQVLDRVDELRTGRPSSRSVSLRKSASSKRNNTSLLSPNSDADANDGWADFSAFEEINSDADAGVTISSATSSQSSWRVVSRHGSTADRAERARESIDSEATNSPRRSSLSGARDQPRWTQQQDHEQRRKLSIRGKQLLAAALST